MSIFFFLLFPSLFLFFFFFFNDTATTEIYTLSLHDALPISDFDEDSARFSISCQKIILILIILDERSEEHTSELQSRSDLVCRLLLEKKKKKKETMSSSISTATSQNAPVHSDPHNYTACEVD